LVGGEGGIGLFGEQERFGTEGGEFLELVVLEAETTGGKDLGLGGFFAGDRLVEPRIGRGKSIARSAADVSVGGIGQKLFDDPDPSDNP
jgi:hypothetical protein